MWWYMYMSHFSCENKRGCERCTRDILIIPRRYSVKMENVGWLNEMFMLYPILIECIACTKQNCEKMLWNSKRFSIEVHQWNRYIFPNLLCWQYVKMCWQSRNISCILDKFRENVRKVDPNDGFPLERHHRSYQATIERNVA